MVADSVGTWLGVAISLVGFGLAFRQLRKTKSAVESARDAVVLSERRMADNLLIGDLTRLQEFEIELGAALANQQRGDAARILVQWRQAAARSEGLLRTRHSDSLLAEVLASAIGVVSLAGDALNDLPTVESSSIPRARQAIAEATAKAIAELPQLQVYNHLRDSD